MQFGQVVKKKITVAIFAVFNEVLAHIHQRGVLPFQVGGQEGSDEVFLGRSPHLPKGGKKGLPIQSGFAYVMLRRDAAGGAGAVKLKLGLKGRGAYGLRFEKADG